MDLERRRDRDRYARELGYQTPPGMVEAATAARLDGDWRGACAAAGVDVHVDLREVAARFGAGVAAMIEADLAGFAPDFLRRHLPRAEECALLPGMKVALSRRVEPFPVYGTPVLLVTLPPLATAPQRLVLEVALSSELTGEWLDLPAWTWHAGAAADRRWAYGASDTRLPWHFADGTPYPHRTSTTADPAADRAAEFEQLLAPVEPERIDDLYRSAGMVFADGMRLDWHRWQLQAAQDRLPLLAAEARRLAHRYGEQRRNPEPGTITLRPFGRGGLEMYVPRRGAPRVDGWVNRAWLGESGVPCGFGVAAPRDAALLRWGVLTPDELHPLVHDALFPGRAQHWRPPRHDPYQSIRVRCGAQWHLIEVAGAALRIPDHDEAEIRRETMLAVFGGRAAGCAAAMAGFRTGHKPIPKEIRKWRRHLFARIFHGDTDTVLTDLAAGFDPLLRDPQGRSLWQAAAAAGADDVLAALTPDD